VAELLVSFAVAMTTAPSVNSHELVEHPALVLPGGRAVLPGVLLRDLLLCCHRQPLTHPPSYLQCAKQDPGAASFAMKPLPSTARDTPLSRRPGEKHFALKAHQTDTKAPAT
jgi:hypothetical protein